MLMKKPGCASTKAAPMNEYLIPLLLVLVLGFGLVLVPKLIAWFILSRQPGESSASHAPHHGKGDEYEPPGTSDNGQKQQRPPLD